jgi:hypothetical protein
VIFRFTQLIAAAVSSGKLKDDEHFYFGKVNGKLATTFPKNIEVNELNRLSTNYKFDRDEKVLIKIIDDDEFNELCDDSKENLSDTQSSEEETDDEDDVQDGGTTNYEYKAAKYKLKYLELKFDLL